MKNPLDVCFEEDQIQTPIGEIDIRLDGMNL